MSYTDCILCCCWCWNCVQSRSLNSGTEKRVGWCLQFAPCPISSLGCMIYRKTNRTNCVRGLLYSSGAPFEFRPEYRLPWGTRWCIWLRHCAKSRKVAGAIPDGVIGIFHWHNPSGPTMALGLTQPLTKWVPVVFPGGKGCRCVGLTTLPHSGADCLEIWEPQTPRTLWASPRL
jgi:hypothetical protein